MFPTLHRPSTLGYHHKILATPNLTAYFPVRDTDARVTDISSNAFQGAWAGTVASKGNSWRGGKYGQLTNGMVSVYSAGYLAAMSKTELSLNFFVKDSSWAGAGDDEYFLHFWVDANNYILLKSSSLGVLYPQYKASGAAISAYIGAACWSTTQWVQLTYTLSKSNDRIRLYVNGGLVASVGTLGVFVGAISSLYCGFCNYRTTSLVYPMVGGISNIAIWSRELTAAQVQAASLGTPPVLAMLGDSISIFDSKSNWQIGVCTERYMRPITHAVSGNSIMDHMAGQAAAAAADNADVIIIELGTNDTDDPSIVDEYYNGIAALQLSNPNARIYGMGILNKTDQTGRAAVNGYISDACTAAGIPYWDTEGWIVPATDTADGLHPNSLGAAKIKTQILARI